MLSVCRRLSLSSDRVYVNEIQAYIQTGRASYLAFRLRWSGTYEVWYSLLVYSAEMVVWTGALANGQLLACGGIFVEIEDEAHVLVHIQRLLHPTEHNLSTLDGLPRRCGSPGSLHFTLP